MGGPLAEEDADEVECVEWTERRWPDVEVGLGMVEGE
jgi:hypothetical protein